MATVGVEKTIGFAKTTINQCQEFSLVVCDAATAFQPAITKCGVHINFCTIMVCTHHFPTQTKSAAEPSPGFHVGHVGASPTTQLPTLSPRINAHKCLIAVNGESQCFGQQQTTNRKPSLQHPLTNWGMNKFIR